jgi:thioredoxin-dependent peroxiredoxin
MSTTSRTKATTKKAAPAAKTPAAANPEPHAEASAGEAAPPFTLPADDGKTVSLADFAGKKVVLYFYPKDDTPGCTRQACAFQDNLARVQSRGAVVLGVSRDGAKSHEKFKTKYKLAFPLLSDPDASVHRAYGAWGMKTNYGKTTEGVLRTTVIIDEKGRIAKRFPNVKVDGHADKVLEALEALGKA